MVPNTKYIVLQNLHFGCRRQTHYRRLVTTLLTAVDHQGMVERLMQATSQHHKVCIIGVPLSSGEDYFFLT